MDKVGSLGRGRSVRSTNRKAESRKADCIRWVGVEFEVCVSGQKRVEDAVVTFIKSSHGVLRNHLLSRV